VPSTSAIAEGYDARLAEVERVMATPHPGQAFEPSEFKFNGGRGALLCSKCRTIVHVGAAAPAEGTVALCVGCVEELGVISVHLETAQEEITRLRRRVRELAEAGDGRHEP
jgi:hypothetical protein